MSFSSASVETLLWSVVAYSARQTRDHFADEIDVDLRHLFGRVVIDVVQIPGKEVVCATRK